MSPEALAQRLAAFLQRSHGARSVRVEGLPLLSRGADYNVILRSGVRRKADAATKNLSARFLAGP